MKRMKNIMSFFLAMLLCLTNMNVLQVHADEITETDLSSKEDQSVELNDKLSTLEKRLKDSGKLEENESLWNLSGDIPVLIVLKEKEEYKAKDFSFSSLESICNQIALSEQYQEEFLKKAEDKLPSSFPVEAVSHVLGQVLKAELSVVDLMKIADMEEVERISPNYEAISVSDELPQRSAMMRMSRSVYDPKELKGRGELIAIIDTGFDTGHSDFVMDDMEGSKYPNTEEMNSMIAQLNSSISDEQNKFKGQWINNKFPYGYNFANNSIDVSEEGNSHGTHVAAIAAASKGYKGQAPAAQILAMSVLAGESDLATPDKYIRAIEQSVLLGASSINLSFGIPSSTLKHVGEEVLQTLQKARSAGVLINVSAGNSSYTDADLQPPKVDQPNYGTISAPALTPDMLAVASLDSDSVRLPYLESGSEKIPYYPCADEAVIDSYNQNLPLVDVGYATKEEIEKLSADALSGKAVLVERGYNRFDEKVSLVAAKGAKAAIIYDNTDSNEWTNMGIHDPNIPAVFLRRNDGMKLKEKINQGVEITLRKEIETFKLDSAGDLSYFSSWGPTPEFDLKPEITAVGGHVWAAQPGNTHADKSGTSMAAPQVTGVSALLQERIKKDADLQLPYDVDQEKMKQYDFLKNMLMSTAVPHTQIKGDPYASPRKQGAGIMNKNNVLSTYAFVSVASLDGTRDVAKINLGSMDTKFDLTFKVHNISKTKTIIFDKVIATVQTDRLDENNPSFIVPVGAQRVVEDISLDRKITLQPGTSEEITIPVDISKKGEELSKKFINGYFIDGFVRLESSVSGQCDIGLPYIGFCKADKDGNKVEFYDTPVIERPIYEYKDLSETSQDVPKYYRTRNARENNPFTALMSTVDGKTVVLGETTPEQAKVRTFQKEKIAFSPNDDGSQDFVKMRATFISQYIQDHIEVYNSSNQLVYKGKNGYSGEKGMLGIVEVGRKNQATASGGSAGALYSESEEYVWDGNGNQNLECTEGEYTFVFSAKGVDKNAKEQRYEFKVYLDKTAPKLIDIKNEQQKITAILEERGSGIKSVQLEHYDADGVIITQDTTDVAVAQDNCITVSYDENTLSSTYLRVTDFAGNSYFSSLKALLSDGKTGSVSVKLEGAYGLKETDYEIKVIDDKNQVQLDLKNLTYGAYTAKLKMKTLNYIPKNDTEREKAFEIKQDIPTAEVTFNLKYQYLQPLKLPILTSAPKGDFGMAERPKIIVTNEDGISVEGKSQVGFGSGGCYFGLNLTPGKWTAEVVSTDKEWKLIPEKLEFEVDETGGVTENKNLPFLYVGPKLHQILPQFDFGDSKITEKEIAVTAIYRDATEANHKWNGREITDNLMNLPPAFYIVKLNVPEGYYADPAQIEVDLTGKSAAPKFVIHKKSANDFGRFSIETRVDGKLTGNLGVSYQVENEQGTEVTNLSNLPYGIYKIKARNLIDGYDIDKTEKEFCLGPSTDGSKIVFDWKSFANFDKKGTLAIWSNWNNKFSDFYEFSGNMQTDKPYIFHLKRMDKQAEDLNFAMAGTFDRMELQNIPYGKYELIVDLSAKQGFFVDRPKVIITINQERTKLDIKYGKDEVLTAEYPIEIQQTDGVVLTCDNENAKEAQQVSVKANVTELNKELAGIFVNNTFVAANGREEIAFSMPAEKVAIVAKIQKKKTLHTIKIEPCENGTIETDETHAVQGEGISLTVTSEEGYRVKEIKYNHINIDNSEFLMPDEDVVITAIFEKTPLKLEELEQALRFAQAKRKDVRVSKQNGEDIEEDNVWVTQEIQAELEKAISEAQNVMRDAQKQEDIDNAVTKLNEAMSDYNPLKGTKSTPYGKTVYFESLKADGEANVTTTTALTLKLSEDISNLEQDNIVIDGAEVNSIEKVLGTDGEYIIHIENIILKNGEMLTVKLSKDGYYFSPQEMKVIIYKKEEGTIPQLDKTALENAIKLALAKQEKVEVAVDAISVEKGKYWVTQEIHDKLVQAVEKARQVLEQIDTSTEQFVLDKAAEELNKVIAEYNPISGTKELAPTPINPFVPNENSSSEKSYKKERDKKNSDTQNLKNKKTEEISQKKIEMMQEEVVNFIDVNPNRWYAKSIAYVTKKRLMEGVAYNRFAPNANATRAMSVQILYNLAGRPQSESIYLFEDVERTVWYKNAIDWAVGNKIAAGINKTMFQPNDNITREQMVTILYNFARARGIDVSTSAELNGYKDAHDISSWASIPMKWAVTNGIFKGMEDNTLRPKAIITRAEIASILQRYTEKTDK